MQQEEPCDWRLSSTVPWERRGETPLRDPTTGKFKKEKTSKCKQEYRKLIMAYHDMTTSFKIKLDANHYY